MGYLERAALSALLYGVVIGFALGWGIAMLNAKPVDADLLRIQQQRNAWAQYQEAGEVQP